MAQSAAVCSPNADAAFGPVIIFSVGTSGLLLLIAPLRVAQLYKQHNKAQPHWLLAAKLACLVIFGALQLTLLVVWSTLPEFRTRTSVPAACLATLDAISLALLSILEHKRSARPSAIICIYLLFSSLLDLAQVRTLWLLPGHDVVAGLLTASVVTKCSLLFFESWEKRSFLQVPYSQLPPEALAGVLNTSVFLWINALIKHGYHAIIVVEDLFATDPSMGSNVLEEKVLRSRTPRRGLLHTLLSRLREPALQVVIPRLCLSAFRLSQPLLIDRTIQLIEAPETPGNRNIGYGLIAATALIYIGLAIANAKYQRQLYRLVTMIRGSLVCLIYDTTLEVAADEVEKLAAVTLMSTDVDKVTTAVVSSHSLWAGPIEAGVAIYLLERQLGVACIAPVVLSLACTIGALSIMNWASNSQKEWVGIVQERVATTATVLDSIKDVKMQGLKDYISAKLHALRVEELYYAKPFRRNIICTAGISNITTLCGPVLTFTMYVLVSRVTSGSTLDIAQAFTSISLISLLSTSISEVVQAIPTFAAGLGCLSRIQTYVNPQDEEVYRGLPSSAKCPLQPVKESATTEPQASQVYEKTLAVEPAVSNGQSTRNDDSIVTLDRVSVGYAGQDRNTLNDITLRIKRGSLNLITGPVGCGKSTLAKAVLGELPLNSGSIWTNVDTIAYCAQNTWLPNRSLREIVLGGALLEPAWYATVIEACALRNDIADLHEGDQTVVGSKGALLSGGQKQRLSLARAIYARKELIVLDSVLSGLDIKTDNWIGQAVLGPNGLCKRHGTTVILISHAVHHVRWADHLVAMNKSGEIVEQGSHDTLLVHNRDAIKSLYAPTSKISQAAGFSGPRLIEETKPKPKPKPKPKGELDLSRWSGDISLYAYVARSVGWYHCVWFFSTVLLFTLPMELQNVLLGYWSTADMRSPGKYTNLYLGVYGMLAGLALLGLLSLLANMLLFAGPKMSIRLHEILLKATMNAPLHWFVSTDSGITLNRFSQDMSLIDMDLLVGLADTAAGLSMATIEAVLIALGAKWIALALPAIFGVVYLLQKIYLRTSRQLRHLDLEAKEPLYSHFLEICSGMSTVRAFGWCPAMTAKTHKLLDMSQRPFYLLYCLQCWLGLVLDLIVAGIAIVLIALATQVRSTTSGAALGVALVNVLNFNITLSFLIKKWTALETSLGAVARTRVFEREMEGDDRHSSEGKSSVEWHHAGEVVMDNVSVAYKPRTPLVLHDISIRVRDGERVGIIGRTGSGKSSFLLTLLRQTTLEVGTISINGVDLSSLPELAVCCSLISVPQELCLLPGTVRSNADPFGSVSDDIIAATLDAAGLGEVVRIKGGLSAKMDHVKMSRGQQQLFGVARALCRKEALGSRKQGLLLLDEVTSGVDVETEQRIMKLLADGFCGWTVISVAHRLEALTGYDRVILLDKGKIVEDRLL